VLIVVVIMDDDVVVVVGGVLEICLYGFVDVEIEW